MASLSLLTLIRGPHPRKVYVMDAANYKNGLMPVRKHVPGVQYFLEHHFGFFYILSNAPSENITLVAEGYHLVRCRAERSSLATWQLAGYSPTWSRCHLSGYLVLFLQKEGLPMRCAINMPVSVDNEVSQHLGALVQFLSVTA